LVADGNVDRFYTRCDQSRAGSGSFRATPAWRAYGSIWQIPRSRKNKLYHPVKQA
jgi:hypothetical protein